MTPDEIKALLLYQNEAHFHARFPVDQPLSYYIQGLAGEAIEVAEPLYSYKSMGRTLMHGTQVIAELGDWAWYAVIVLKYVENPENDPWNPRTLTPTLRPLQSLHIGICHRNNSRWHGF